MGVVETNVVRRVNELVVNELDWPVYQSLVKNLLAVDVLADAAGRGRRCGCRPTTRTGCCRRARRWSRRCARRATRSPATSTTCSRRTGDAEPRHPDDVSDAEMLDAAIYAVAGLLHQLQAERETAVEQRASLAHRLVPRPFRWAIDRYRDARVRLHDSKSHAERDRERQLMTPFGRWCPIAGAS